MKRAILTNSQIKRNNTFEGDNILVTMKRALQGDGDTGEELPTYFTERKAGVLPGFNIRTDRWEVARKATETLQKSETAQRERAWKERNGISLDSGASESTDGTD